MKTIRESCVATRNCILVGSRRCKQADGCELTEGRDELVREGLSTITTQSARCQADCGNSSPPSKDQYRLRAKLTVASTQGFCKWSSVLYKK